MIMFEMMGSSSEEESGISRSLEGISLSSENGITNSTDDCGGPKPGELYGKYTWKIDKFSQLNKTEFRSNAFEVGGYQWERVDRPFRCLECEYRRELVRVYLSNVEQICRGFVEEMRGRLGKLIQDKVGWSSFRTLWLGMDQRARRDMTREKSDSILKVIVKQLFIEKEVTSTLVMDSLYSGLKALEVEGHETKKATPMVRVEKDAFILVVDVLLLLERAAFPPKDEQGPQNKDGEEEDFSSIDDERRLSEVGRTTIEIFVLMHIFSKIEVAYQEAVALKRQEEEERI